jgi:hypothetical protein
MRRILMMFVGGLVLSGCFVVGRDYLPQNSMMNQERGWFVDSESVSNGENIYFTAINDQGQRIRYSGGPNFGGMMMGTGNNLACASCHGSDGRGGIHTMHMDVMDAPDIRFEALSNEAVEHGDDEHGDEHREYDLAAFRQAVVEGKHPDGDALNRDMPRWRMDDRDLADLFEFLENFQ